MARRAYPGWALARATATAKAECGLACLGRVPSLATTSRDFASLNFCARRLSPSTPIAEPRHSTRLLHDGAAPIHPSARALRRSPRPDTPPTTSDACQRLTEHI